MTDQTEPDQAHTHSEETGDDELRDWLTDFGEALDLPEGLDLTDRDTPFDTFGSGGAIRWEELVGEAREQQWVRLRTFVHWWVRRYNIPKSTLPACWYLHGGLVEELTALMSARAASFSDADTGLGPIGWHERNALVRSRIESSHYRGECQGGHTPTDVREIDKEADWDEHLTQQAHVTAAPLE